MREWLPAFAQWLKAARPPQISVEDAQKTDGGADAVYYGTQMRGVSNAKAKLELNLQPRPLEWTVDTEANLLRDSWQMYKTSNRCKDGNPRLGGNGTRYH
jgi:hypothetical protein